MQENFIGAGLPGISVGHKILCPYRMGDWFCRILFDLVRILAFIDSGYLFLSQFLEKNLRGAIMPKVTYKIGILSVLLLCALLAQAAQAPVSIPASFKTVSTGNDVDDAAIWVHPDAPEKSVVFINDKGPSLDVSGIYVFALDGTLLYKIPLHNPVNPDVRYDVVFGSDTMDVMVCVDREAGNNAYNRIRVFQIHPEKSLSSSDFTTEITVPAGIPSGQSEAYGHSLYLRQSDRALFSVVSANGKADLTQIKLSRNSEGLIGGTVVRTWGRSDIGGPVCEGICADDEHGYLYVCDEDVAVLKYAADPDRKIDSVVNRFAQGDGISGDREGINIYRCADGTGYLLLSSQGNHRIHVYDRMTNAFIGVLAPEGVTDCDGLDVTSMALGSAFPNGMAALHLGSAAGAQFGFYDWGVIAEKLKLSTPCAIKRNPTTPAETDKKLIESRFAGTSCTAILRGNALHVQMPFRVSGPAEILLFGLAGNLQMSINMSLIDGSGSINIRDFDVPPGLYLVISTIGGKRYPAGSIIGKCTRR